MSSLPTSITSLKLVGSPPCLTLSEGTQLPPKLVKLSLDTDLMTFEELRHTKSQGIDISAFWPKTLQSLSVGHSCHPNDLKIIPTTLKSLKMEFSIPLSTLILKTSDFPPNLTRCFLNVRDVETHLEIIGDTLPASLTTFGGNGSYSCLYGRSTIEEKLPSTLTSLTFAMQHDPLPDDAPWTLPSRLNMRQWRVEWLASLPRHLTSLTISELCGLSEVLAVGPFDLFEHLPTTLTYLQLRVSKRESLPPNYGVNLPSHHLTSLPRLRNFISSLQYSVAAGDHLPVLSRGNRYVPPPNLLK